LPPESLARVRRKRLTRRVTAKVPMFADHFIDAELARKPDYYDGITDPNIEVSLTGVDWFFRSLREIITKRERGPKHVCVIIESPHVRTFDA
jgi:hypothetical protein